MNRAAGLRLIEQKVADFHKNEPHYLSKAFQETETRNRFIDPLFQALGWDFEQTHLPRDEWDVHREYSQKERDTIKKPDYAFRVKRKPRFFVEAKAPHVPLTDKRPVFQAKKYAFSSHGRVPVIVITDFQEFRVFNAYQKPLYDNPLQGLIKDLDLAYTQYPAKWDLLWDTFSKEAVLGGSIDLLAKKVARNTKTLDDEFLTDLTAWREMLARNIAVRNPRLTADELNECVQRILDRLIFIRNLEDREIEHEDGLAEIAETREGIYPALLPIFRTLDAEYNGLLFKKHLSEELTVDDEALKKIIKAISPRTSPYQFDIIEPEILGRIYERFLGDYGDTRPKAGKLPSTGRERGAPLPPREVNSLGSTLTPSRGLTALGLTPDSGESGAIRLTEGHRAKVELGQEFNPNFGATPTGVCGIFELVL